MLFIMIAGYSPFDAPEAGRGEGPKQMNMVTCLVHERILHYPGE